MKMKNRKKQKGEGLVSYIIVLALVVLVCVSAAQFLGGSISNLFVTTGEKVEDLEKKVDKIKVK